MTRCAALRDALALLGRRPELRKVVLASSLLASATIMSPIIPLVVVELKARVWARRMTEYTALANLANGLVAVACSTHFGRLGDKIGRRSAMLVVGVLGFLPTWALLAVGQNGSGLMAFSIFSAFGGAACISLTGCPTCYALLNDVMPPDEREVAFGISFASLVIVTVVCNLFAYGLKALCNQSPTAVLVYAVGLQFAYFAAVGSLRRLPVLAAIPDCAEGNVPEECTAAHLAVCPSGPSSDTGTEMVRHSTAPTDTDGISNLTTTVKGRFIANVHALLAPPALVFELASLMNICFVAALVSLSEVVLTDVTSQFILDEFELVGSKDEHRQTVLTILSQWPGFALLLPGFMFAGLMGKMIGPLNLLRRMLPATALLLLLPGVLRMVPEEWLVPIVGAGVPLAMVVFVPLQTLITHVAPPDRVGEAMGAVGASKQVAGLVGNLLVMGLSRALFRLHWPKPLWVYYPLGSLCAWLALPIAYKIQLPQAAPTAAPVQETVAGGRHEERV